MDDPNYDQRDGCAGFSMHPKVWLAITVFCMAAWYGIVRGAIAFCRWLAS